MSNILLNAPYGSVPPPRKDWQRTNKNNSDMTILTWIAEFLHFSVTVAGVWGKVDGKKRSQLAIQLGKQWLL